MKNLEERQKILDWANEAKILSAHDTFDDVNDNIEAIKAFYSSECPKDECGIVLSLEDVEILMYEYARRLMISIESKK